MSKARDIANLLSAGASTGATGSNGDEVFFQNDKTVTSNYIIPSNINAMSAGPVTIDTGVTVEIQDGAVWTIV
jgi:hypothetical protein